MNQPKVQQQRIIFLSATSGIWGAEESLLTLAKALQKQGHVVGLVAFEGPLVDRWRSEIGNSPVVAGACSDPDSKKLTTAAKIWWRYVRSAQRDDTIVLFTYYLVLLAPAARILRAFSRTRIVLDMHDNLPGVKGRWLLQNFSRAVHRIVAVSHFTAQQFGSQTNRVAVLHRPVIDVHKGSASPEPMASGGPLRVGIVGRVVRGKGHELLLDAASTIGDSVRIIVRGDGDGSADDIKEAIVSSGSSRLGNGFIFEGPVARADVMKDLDVLVVGNDREPMGRTVIEAQLHHVAAVVPNKGGSSELVENGVTGLKYMAQDAASLANALRSLQSDSFRKRLTMTARETAVHSSSPSRYGLLYSEAVFGDETA
ncbi:glycosyltransferase family 4 protein [Paenarthrobacter nitroguajacolicus]|uniref:glycosyltransferase family 4 protein n=1 Tax=Paenarthrobacter nitroguajacolicus TaxID=211146 RepID=UPI003427D7FE